MRIELTERLARYMDEKELKNIVVETVLQSC